MPVVDLTAHPTVTTPYGRWQPLNGPLGVAGFGISAIVCDPGEEFDIEHDETESGQQEAYIVVAGRGFFRIGSEGYAEENETYGLATMRKRHVTVSGDSVANATINDVHEIEEIVQVHELVIDPGRHEVSVAGEPVQTSFDRDRTFMLVEIVGDSLYFQTISRSGETIDSGQIARQAASVKAAGAK
jgi:hypothetical protein